MRWRQTYKTARRWGVGDGKADTILEWGRLGDAPGVRVRLGMATRRVGGLDHYSRGPGSGAISTTPVEVWRL
jgi:hypothetical protein